MNTAIVPFTLAPLPSQVGRGCFTQGFVSAGCLSAFQDFPVPASAADMKRVLRLALQGGTALAAGNHAAFALRQRDYARVLLAAATGAAGVLIIERLLRDVAQTNREKSNV